MLWPSRKLGLVHYAMTVVAVVICALGGFNLGSLLLSLIVSYRIVEQLADQTFFDSKILVTAVSLFFYSIVLQCAALSLWLIDKNFPLDKSVLAALGVLLISYFFAVPQTRSHSLPWIRRGDVVGLAVCLAILAGITIPILKTSGLHGDSTLAFVNASIDDSHHLEFLNDHLQFNRAVLYGSDATSQVRNPDDISTYPAGWHAANAAIIKAIDPGIRTGIKSVEAYVATKLAWYVLLLYLFVRVAYILYDLLREKATGGGSEFWLAGGCLLFAFFFLIAPFRQGFYSFIPQLIAVLLVGLSLLQLNSSKHDAARSRSPGLVLAATFCIGGGLPWMLILPGLLIALTITFALHCQHNKLRWRAWPRVIARALLADLPLYLLLAAALAAQTYLMLAAPTTSLANHLTMQGAIEVYDEAFYAFIAAGIVLVLSLAGRTGARHIKALLILLGSILALTAYIGILHFFKLYDYAYYYFKALNTFTVIAIPASLAGFALLMNTISRKRDRTTGLLVSIVLVLAVVQFIGPNPGYPNGLIGGNTHGQIAREEITYVQDVRVVTPPLNAFIWRTLAAQKTYGGHELTFVYTPGDVSQNEIGSLLLKTNRPANGCYTFVNLNIHNAATNDALAGYLQQACTGYKLTIATAPGNLADLQSAIFAAGLRNVQIVPAE